MPISIRRASSQDAQAIAKLIKLAFGEAANIAHISTIISEGKHLAFVAEDEAILGFIDGFYTQSQTGLIRLELDLLAIAPEHSNKGIAKSLINAFVEANEGAALSRALVAVDNLPMQAVMQKMGYKQELSIHSLYISSEGEGSALNHDAHFIPVKTFTYTGIWLEGEISLSAIKSAHLLREKQALEVLGVVLPNEKEASIEILEKAGFDFIKSFHWWIYSLAADEVLKT